MEKPPAKKISVIHESIYVYRTNLPGQAHQQRRVCRVPERIPSWNACACLLWVGVCVIGECVTALWGGETGSGAGIFRMARNSG